MSALNIRNLIQGLWIFLAIAQTQLIRFCPKLIRWLLLHLKFKTFKHFNEYKVVQNGQERDLKQDLYQRDYMVEIELNNLF